MANDGDILNRLEDAIKLAQDLGATGASVDYYRGDEMKMGVRQKAGSFCPTRSVDEDITLRVFVDRRSATASISSLKQGDLRDAVRAAVENAKFVSENEHARLADISEIAGVISMPDIHDPACPAIEDLRADALAAERAALHHPQITNSEGGTAFRWEGTTAMMATNGFTGLYKKSINGLYAAVLAGTNADGMVVAGYESTAIYRSDLLPPADVGARAASDTVRKLGAKQPASGHYPVVFSPDIGPQIMAEFLNAASGRAVMRGQSFLRGKLGQKIFDPGITIIDDPLIDRGLGSRPFDAEGVPGRRLALVENGVLKTWFMDIESAGKLGMKSTGHAGGLTNSFIQAGARAPDRLVEEIPEGLYVTGLMGHSDATLTGDFSLGAEGFWIENGQISYPVNEITIAGKLGDMFMNMEAANDLDLRRGSAATPTLRIDGMSIGGR